MTSQYSKESHEHNALKLKELGLVAREGAKCGNLA